METKHTPTPWDQLHGYVDTALNELKAVSPFDGPESLRIAAFIDDLVKKSDAALVRTRPLNGINPEAVPLMMDALVSAFHLITDGEKFSKDHPWNKEATIKRIKEAIAKAEVRHGS